MRRVVARQQQASNALPPIERHPDASYKQHARSSPQHMLSSTHLTPQPAGLGEREGEVQHVVLVVAWLVELVKHTLLQDHMAGGARQRTLARALKLHIVLVRRLQKAARRGRRPPQTQCRE